MARSVTSSFNGLFVLVLLFAITFVAAVPPVDTIFTGETGLNVEVNIMPTYQVGEERWTLVHLFNATSGYQITNTTNDNISCHMHLRDSQGFEIMNVEATVVDDYWALNGSGGVNNPAGRYAWTLACQDGTSKVGGYASGYFDITSTGQILQPVNTVIVGALISLAFIFLILSFFFKDDYWILKSFFQFLAVLAGLIAVNSARIIASESNTLGVMGTSGLILIIASVALFFLWIFVRAFKEVIKIFKDKGDVRWNYD